MKKFITILLILIGLFILLIGSTVYAYLKDPVSVLKYLPEKLISPEIKAKAEYAALEKIFPVKLGSYDLYHYNNELPIMVKTQCEDPSTHPDTKRLGISGEICVKTISAQYRNSADNKVVFINFTQVSKGRDLMLPLLARYGKSDSLGDYNILRVEAHEIVWLPAKEFDSAVTQEGRWSANSNGGESYSYKEKATGDNPVTQYFISKYPPELKSDKE